jgi:hypothetical protein
MTIEIYTKDKKDNNSLIRDRVSIENDVVSVNDSEKKGALKKSTMNDEGIDPAAQTDDNESNDDSNNSSGCCPC